MQDMLFDDPVIENDQDQIVTASQPPRITATETTNLPVDQLERHPGNRPLGLNLEKIEQLKASIAQYGFYSNQPVVVRPVNSHYQIIKGEHRVVAAKELGFDAIPCSVQEMTDSEALIQLIVGNIQTENKALEIGLNALEFVTSYGRNGASQRAYANSIGQNGNTVGRYIRAAEVYVYLLNVCRAAHILEESKKLEEIGKCDQTDWMWFHDLIMDRGLSHDQSMEISKAIRELDKAIAPSYLPDLINGPELKPKIAREIVDNGKSRTLPTALLLARTITENYAKIDDDVILYTYDLQTDKIVETPANLQNDFIALLKTQKKLEPPTVGRVALDILEKKQRHSKDAAESIAAYYRNAKNQKETQQRIDMERQLDQEIVDAWLACESNESIALSFKIDLKRVERVTDAYKLVVGRTATFTELVRDVKGEYVKDTDGNFVPGFDVPIYNVWTFMNKTNDVTHFGNSEQTIVENLLYLYTDPFDVVLDPFAGGGSTLDVCRKRDRRCWTADRKPITDREHEIRKHDLAIDGMPNLGALWPDVALTYLDPPYWRQAAGQYSNDPTDLANMPLDKFTETLVGIVDGIAQLQQRGVIALIIQPTQWSSDDKQFVDHVSDLVCAVDKRRLLLENRVSCPYQTQQYNAQQVEFAKAHKKLLVLTRELIVWRIV